jgi:hypothetical protein
MVYPTGINNALPTVQANAVNQSPMNNSWFSGAGDFLTAGLGTWLAVEQVNAMKDSGRYGQNELSNTIQTPNPAYPNPAAQMRQQMGEGLQIGVGTMGLVVGGIAVLYWLTRK